MTQFDACILIVIFISGLLGWWRGLVHEVLSLISWVTAYFVAKSWMTEFTPYMPDVIGSPAMRSVLAFVSVYVVTLILCAVASWAIYKLARWAGLDWTTDSVSGAMFGLVRGVLIVVLLVMLAGFTRLPQTSFWKEAILSKPLQGVAMFARDLLPEELASQIHY